MQIKTTAYTERVSINMGEKDLAEKYLESYNDVFADIVNVLIFNGEEVVKPSELEECGIQSVYKAEGKVQEQNRDIAKLWTKNEIIFSFIGFENQTEADKDMPLRIIGYDGARYRKQYKETVKDSEGKDVYPEHYPVVTLVLYFGTTRWNYPKNLKGCFKTDRRLDTYVSDYKMNLFEIAFLSEETVEKFTSDFGIIANYFVQKRLGKRNFSKKVIDHVDALMTMLRVLTGDNRFEKMFESWNLTAKKGGIRMCEFLDQMIAEGKAEGEEKLGKLIVLLLEKGDTEAAKLVSTDKKIRDEYFKKYSIK